MPIERGDELEVRTAFDEWVLRIAASGVEQGATFDVVWVCKDAEWDRASAEGEEPDTVPWPANEVRARGTGALRAST